jgi:UDP-glucose 4-epimerase
MKTVLIFGATGTIGAYTALYLKSKGYNIIATGRRVSDNNFFSDYRIPYFSIDISRMENFINLDMIKPDVILHCAGIMPAAMAGYNPQEYVDSIITGTLNILKYMNERKINKIVFTQSHADSSYLMESKNPIPSDIEKKFPLTGDHSIYSICKNAAVDMIEHFFYEYEIKRFILRLPTIYAYHPNPYFYVNGEKKFIAYRYIIEQAIRGQKIEIWGDPAKQKEITYIKDLCQIFEKATESNLDGGMYNVGRGIGVTLETQIKGIIDIFGTEKNKSQILYCPEKPDAHQFIHDITKTVSELNYKPEYDYEKLLIDFREEMYVERFVKLWGKRENY